MYSKCVTSVIAKKVGVYFNLAREAQRALSKRSPFMSDQKLENLTPEQQAQLPIWRDKWIAIGLSCDPCDLAKSIPAVNEAYKAANLEPPKHILLCDSPMSGAITAALLKNRPALEKLVDTFGGCANCVDPKSVWGSVFRALGLIPTENYGFTIGSLLNGYPRCS